MLGALKNGMSSTEMNPWTIYESLGVYYVDLIAIGDSSICADTAELAISVESPSSLVHIPIEHEFNAFFSSGILQIEVMNDFQGNVEVIDLNGKTLTLRKHVFS